jgi:hypothetical protein
MMLNPSSPASVSKSAALVLGAAWLLLGVVAMTRAADPVYPGKSWAAKPPGEAGLDAAKLKTLADYVGGQGCVVRHGYLVFTWGDASKRGDVASAAKPVYAHFLFKALEEGKIASFDEKVSKWEPRLAELNKALDHKDRDITWRHLANQTSCYGVSEKPGTAFCYNDWQMALFWDALFGKVYGTTYDQVDQEVFHRKLTDPLQCEDSPTLMAFGSRDRPGRLGISPRDFARFGLLYLRRGEWNGKQLLDAKHAAMAVTSPLPSSLPQAGKKAAEMIAKQRTMGSSVVPDNQTDHFGSYSWLWWVNGTDRNGTRMWPDAPADAYGAFGHGGPRALWVMPSLDIVVSYNDARLKGWTSGVKSPTNQAMKLLLEAVMAGKPPGQGGVPGGKDLGHIGTFGKWSRIEVSPARSARKRRYRSASPCVNPGRPFWSPAGRTPADAPSPA